MGVGSAALPEIFNLRLRGLIASSLPFLRSSGSSARPDINLLYIVGTTVKNVIFRFGCGFGSPFVAWEGKKGAAKRDQTASGEKGKRNSIVDPEKRGAMRALTVPWMWWRGRTWRRWSEGEYCHASRRECACAVRTDMGRRTPFCDVVNCQNEI